MSMTDPIADFLARIRNGIRARKQLVELPRSNVKLRIAEILRDEGFVNSVSSTDDKKQGVLKVELRYLGYAPCLASGTASLRSCQGHSESS
jgi:small subunit ribosomal protein S8